METLTVMLRIASTDSSTKEFELELPNNTTASQIIDAMIGEGHIERVSENGEMIDYRLMLKDSDIMNSGSTFNPNDSLEDFNVKNGSTLIINPHVVPA